MRSGVALGNPTTTYAVPQVADPFTRPTTGGVTYPTASTVPSAPVEFSNPQAYVHQRAARWSQQLQEEGSRLSSMAMEEAALAAEEQQLRGQLAEMHLGWQRLDEDHLLLSQGWAALLEREERYYTEPLVDYMQEIGTRELQCAALRDRLQQAEAHLGHLRQQLQHYDYVLKEKEVTEQELQGVRAGFEGVMQRWRRCVTKAERFFDVETRRVMEAHRAVREVDTQLEEMANTGPLAQVALPARAPTRSSSRCVTFAPDVSIVLDPGRELSQPNDGASWGPGLTSSDSTGPLESIAASSQRAGYVRESRGASSEGPACIGLDVDDIGGTSVAFSLNQPAGHSLKRRKAEPVPC